MENFKLIPIEHCGQRVLTTSQLADAYETESKTISNNFNRNKNRYIEGKHFYRLTGDDVENFCVHHFDEYKNHSKIRILHFKMSNIQMYEIRTSEIILLSEKVEFSPKNSQYSDVRNSYIQK